MYVLVNVWIERWRRSLKKLNNNSVSPNTEVLPTKQLTIDGLTSGEHAMIRQT